MKQPQDLYAGMFKEPSSRRTFRPGGLELTGEAVKIAGLEPGMRALDIGCGTGATVMLLAEEFGLRAVGIDPLVDPEKPGGAPDLVHGQGENLPFAGDTFDAVFAECTLSVTGHTEEVLREMYRVLRPGGVAVISDLCRRDDETAACPPGTCPGGALSRADFRAAAGAAGFREMILEDHTGKLHGFVAAWIMEHGSYRAFIRQFCPGEGRFGYFLYLGKKEAP